MITKKTMFLGLMAFFTSILMVRIVVPKLLNAKDDAQVVVGFITLAVWLVFAIWLVWGEFKYDAAKAEKKDPPTEATKKEIP